MCPVAQQSEVLWGNMGSCEFQAVTQSKCSVAFYLILFLSQHQHCCGNVFCLKREIWGHVELSLSLGGRGVIMFSTQLNPSVLDSNTIQAKGFHRTKSWSCIRKRFSPVLWFPAVHSDSFPCWEIGNGEPCTVALRGWNLCNLVLPSERWKKHPQCSGLELRSWSFPTWDIPWFSVSENLSSHFHGSQYL